MPWRATTTVSLRQELVQLAAQQTVSLSELCRRYRISRKTAYKWLRRYRQAGPAGLTDQSRRPRHPVGQTAPPLEAAVVALRRAHPAWGARKLRRRLQTLGWARVPAASTVTVILHRHSLIAPTAARPGPWQRFERPAPNDLWQMDFKGRVATLAGVGHPLTVLDDHSRFNLCLQVLPNQQTPGVQARLTETFCTYGLPNALLVDNGSPWGDDREHPWTPLTVWLVRVGTQVYHSAPYHPQTLGKEERFHRTLAAEVLATRQWRDLAHCQAACDGWRTVYNAERPHEALDFAVPASRYQPSLRAFPAVLPPIEYPAGLPVRKVQQGGHCSYLGRRFKVPKAFVGYPIALRPAPRDGVYDVIFCHQEIVQLDLRRLREV
jgi:transposase InsO family protein